MGLLGLVPVDVLDAEADLVLLGLHVDHHGLDLIAVLDHFFGVLHPLVAELGDVNQPLDPRFQLDEGSELGHVGDLALNQLADLEPVMGVVPGVLLDLLDSQGKALVLLVDVEDDGLDFLSLAIHLGGMLQPLGPGNVRNVDETRRCPHRSR